MQWSVKEVRRKWVERLSSVPDGVLFPLCFTGHLCCGSTREPRRAPVGLRETEDLATAPGADGHRVTAKRVADVLGLRWPLLFPRKRSQLALAGLSQLLGQ